MAAHGSGHRDHGGRQGDAHEVGPAQVLHRLAGRSLLQHVVDTAAELRGPIASSSSPATAPRWSRPRSPLPACASCARAPARHRARGAAGAARAPRRRDDAHPQRRRAADRGRTCRALLEACADENLALLVVELDDPTGYGRVLRSDAAAAARAKADACARSSSTRTPPRRSARDPRGLHRDHGGAHGAAGAGSPDCATTTRSRVLPDRHRRHGRRRTGAGGHGARARPAEVWA